MADKGPASVPIRISKPNVLFVEGPDDRDFFEAFLEYLELGDVQVVSYDGKSKLRKQLRALTSASDFRASVSSLAIVRDADTNPSGAFQSASDALGHVGLAKPQQHAQFALGRPRTAVLVLPDSESLGEVEDLCLRTVADEPVMKCVDRFLDCVNEASPDSPRKPSKARVQAYLAGQPELRKTLGIAAKAGDWPWGHEAFAHVREFLHALASPGA